MAGTNTIRLRAVLDDKVSSGLAKIRDDFDRLGGKGATATAFGVLGAKAFGAGLGLIKEAAGGAVDAIAGSIKASSDLSEQLSKSNVVFGTAGRSMELWAKSAATSMGLSERAALEAAGTFGNFFTNIGQSQQSAAKMSQQLVGLAGDLASFNNLDPTDVLDKLRSGLSGEAEPLRAVGVFLTEAKVKAKGMQLGLADAHGELSEGAKILARYQLILDETKTAQGDFGRTATGMANQQRILNAQLENTSAQLGEKLAPAVIEFQRNIILGLDRTAISYEQLKRAADAGIVPAINQLKALQAETDAMADDTRETARFTVGAYSKMDDAAKDFGQASTDMAQDNAAANKRIRLESRKTLDQLTDDAHKLIEDYFGPLEREQERDAAHARAAAARKAEAEATTKAARRDAHNEYVNALRDEGEALLDQAQHGEVTKERLTTYARDIRKEFGKVPPALQKVVDAIDLVNERANVDISVNVHPARAGAAKKRASGGFTSGLTLVGEQGPELIDAPTGSYVYNAPQTARIMGEGASQPIVIPLYLDGKKIAEAIAPHRYREWQRAPAFIGRP